MTGKKISICFDELVKLLHRHIGAQKIKRVRVVHREDMLKSVTMPCMFQRILLYLWKLLRETCCTQIFQMPRMAKEIT